VQLENLILNPRVKKFRRLRIQNNYWNSTRTGQLRLLVSIGGSDTRGITLKVLKLLEKRRELGHITCIFGPAAHVDRKCYSYQNSNVTFKQNVPCLIQEFYSHDVAVTGGGITPFEANATGLPCFIISTEEFEQYPALVLDRLGSSLYIGHFDQISRHSFNLNFDIARASKAGLEKLSGNGVELFVAKVMELVHGK